MQLSRSKRLWRDERGTVALILGLALPVVIGGIAAAVEYNSLSSRRSQLQIAADSAALAAAREMGLAGVGDQRVASVAEAAALAYLSEGKPEGTTASVQAKVGRERTEVSISVAETVASVTGRILSLPSTRIEVSAVARLSGRTPICMIGLDSSHKGTVTLQKNAQITAPGCALFSNAVHPQSLIGENNAKATAQLICSAGGYRGKKSTNFFPEPITDCPVPPDPLATRPAPSSSGCAAAPIREIKDATTTLSPGTYCGGLKISKSTVNLLSGVYVIKDGPLIVEKKSVFAGQNVAFFFAGDKAGVRFDADTTISLTAPKDGVMAGLLFFEERTVNAPVPPEPGEKGPAPLTEGDMKLREYRIISDNARTLLGTIYLPAGRLIIDSKKPVADQSAYTVIVARRIELYDGPNLVLNTGYSSTDIPVPKGVGPVEGRISLTR